MIDLPCLTLAQADRPMPAAATAVGVVLPVRDEEEMLDSTLHALLVAAEPVLAAACDVRLVIVLDGCTDRSARIAEAFRRRHVGHPGALSTTTVETGSGNVGMARALGFRRVLRQLEGLDPATVWLATTDADTLVPPGWLTHQLAVRGGAVDAWAGTVAVADWSARSERVGAAFLAGYGSPEGRHVHGANLAFSASAYQRAGGFPPMATGEDHGLWRALRASGASMLHDTTCPVITSARRLARAPLGFASALDLLESDVPPVAQEAG